MLIELFFRPFSVSVVLLGPAEDVVSEDFRLFQFHFADEALILKAEEKMEFVVSCKGKSNFFEEQVQHQEISSNLVY